YFFWIYLGAGVFGFLNNLPIVSYYEIGTNLTANHGHTSMMGVYGMLAAGLLLFCLRYLTRPDMWSDRAAGVSFWSLNIGLAWMAFSNLFPVGVVQLHHAVADGGPPQRSDRRTSNASGRGAAMPSFSFLPEVMDFDVDSRAILNR